MHLHPSRRRSFVCAAVAAAALALSPALGRAQSWPAKQPIRLVAVFPPGGSVDQVARILAPALQAQLGQAVIVDNKGGAEPIAALRALLGERQTVELVGVIAAYNMVSRFLQALHIHDDDPRPPLP